MKITDGKKLWERLKDAPFFRRSISELSKAEMEHLLKLAIGFVEEEGGEYGYKLPSYHGNGHLHIPWNAPAKYRYWEQELTSKEKYELFLEMGVSPEDMHYYMYQAAIEEAVKGEK